MLASGAIKRNCDSQAALLRVCLERDRSTADRNLKNNNDLN
jgi:hypothetical protein